MKIGICRFLPNSRHFENISKFENAVNVKHFRTKMSLFTTSVTHHFNAFRFSGEIAAENISVSYNITLRIYCKLIFGNLIRCSTQRI